MVLLSDNPLQLMVLMTCIFSFGPGALFYCFYVFDIEIQSFNGFKTLT